MSDEEELGPEQILVKLNRLRKDIEEAKNEQNQMIGKKTGLLERLSNEFKLDSLAKARTRIKLLDDQVGRRNKMIDKQFSTLREKYDF